MRDAFYTPLCFPVDTKESDERSAGHRVGAGPPPAASVTIEIDGDRNQKSCRAESRTPSNVTGCRSEAVPKHLGQLSVGKLLIVRLNFKK